LRIAYDGQPYHGFQRQPDVETVEDRIFTALRNLTILEGDDPPSGYAAAGRTDAGVSAVAQTIAFDAPQWLTPAALNSELPKSIRAWASASPSAGFHATHDASSRTYSYFLYAPDADETATSAALAALAGDHDFHNFTPDSTGTRRTLSTTLRRDGPILVLTFQAGGFARQLVRRLVTIVAEIARGDAELERIERLFQDETVSGPAGVSPAPPAPLVLTAVEYPGLSFQVDPEAATRTRSIFQRLHTERIASARVAGSIVENIECRERETQ
jgi:tRNA pseudouridine38-40 synthase